MNERTFHHTQAHKLDDPERLRWLPPDDVLGRLPLKKGITVADIGTGTGYFAIPIAQKIGGQGIVYAVDLQQEMLSLLRTKLSALPGPVNVKPVLGDALHTTLASGSCDIVFMSNLWHELDDYPEVLKETARILRPGGSLAILDWSPDFAPPPGPPTDHRIAMDQVRATVQTNGWTVATAGHVGAYSHFVLAHLGPKGH